MKDQRQVILLLPPFSFETKNDVRVRGELLRIQTELLGYSKPITLLSHLPETAPANAILISDHIARLGPDTVSVVRFIFDALEGGSDVIIPSWFTLQTHDEAYDHALGILSAVLRIEPALEEIRRRCG